MAKSYFSPQLVNSPSQDPSLYMEIAEHKKTILVDCGELYSLTDQQINKIGDIFISHTHIDHFAGFDRIIRSLVRYRYDRSLRVCGPENIAQQVQYKLLSYTWNLPFAHQIEIIVEEITDEDKAKTFHLSSKDHFQQLKLVAEENFTGTLERDSFCVQLARLDHHITSLGFCFQSPESWLVKKEALAKFPHKAGKWVKELIELCCSEAVTDTFQVEDTTYKTEELIDRLLEKKPVEKVAYITDVKGSSANKEKILSLIHRADILFCESHFLTKDQERAEATCHLTASQVGEMAHLAEVKKLELFHFSPRYTRREHKKIVAEAQKAYKN